MGRAGIYLSEKTKKTIVNALGVDNFEDILYMKFPDSADDFDNREDIKRYARLYTDIRLSNGLFYTPKEFDEHINKMLALQFP